MGAMRKVGMSRCVRIRIAVLYIDRQPSDVQRREMRCSPTDLLFRPDRLQYGRIANRTNPFKLFFLLVIILLLFFSIRVPPLCKELGTARSAVAGTKTGRRRRRAPHPIHPVFRKPAERTIGRKYCCSSSSLLFIWSTGPANGARSASG